VDGKTVAPQISGDGGDTAGFRVDFTQPTGNVVSEAILRSALSVESWLYHGWPDYGSPSGSAWRRNDRNGRERGSQVDQRYAFVPTDQKRCIRGRPGASIPEARGGTFCSMRCAGGKLNAYYTSAFSFRRAVVRGSG
jgi:hypothetical protein